jgi:sporulation protein YlmC with PRC-barrel domain
VRLPVFTAFPLWEQPRELASWAKAYCCGYSGFQSRSSSSFTCFMSSDSSGLRNQQGLGVVFNQYALHKGGTALSKINTTAALAAFLMATAPIAYAQVSTAPRTSVAATSVMGSEIQPDQFRATKMIGSAVYDVQNRDIGKVKDLIVDRDGRIAAVVVDVGSFLGVGGKYVALNISDIKTNNNRLTLDRTKEQLQQMAEYRLEDRTTRAGTSTSPATGGRLGR